MKGTKSKQINIKLQYYTDSIEATWIVDGVYDCTLSFLLEAYLLMSFYVIKHTTAVNISPNKRDALSMWGKTNLPEMSGTIWSYRDFYCH